MTKDDNKPVDDDSVVVTPPADDTTPSDDSTTPNVDPLDSMDDAQLRAFALGIGRSPDDSLQGEELLADVKKHRSIHQRRTNKSGEPTTPDDSDDVLRKSDLERSKTKEARESIAESDDPVLSDIEANWTEIAEYYIPRNGKDTVGGILKDMRIARAAYREANPVSDPNEAVRTASQINSSGNGKSPKATEPKKKTLMPKRQGINDWYKKAES